MFTNENGGAIDDSVVTKVTDDHIYLVVNAGCRDKDLAHIGAHLESFKKKGGDVKWHIHDERSLLALQVEENINNLFIIWGFLVGFVFVVVGYLSDEVSREDYC